jgi:predicted DNA repair protein MutK
MSGLLALFDDVAAIAKVAAASVDDVIGQATKAGAQAAGAVIDDAAVTPKYVHGFSADRELPIVGRIALGSIKNKLLILLPVGLLLSAFAPWLIPLLLMLGGAYLCFEGAEKVVHSFQAGKTHAEETGDPAHLEEAKVQGAIKTDFILSAEIMTIALAAIDTPSVWMQAATLFAVAVGITALVYGAVALIVKADDVGLAMARRGRLRATRALGHGIVASMPGLLKMLTLVGTAAMLWVGGSIIVHGFEELGYAAIGHQIHDWAVAVAHQVPARFEGAVEWFVTAGLDGVLGLGLGIALIPVGTKVITPMWRRIMPD